MFTSDAKWFVSMKWRTRRKFGNNCPSQSHNTQLQRKIFILWICFVVFHESKLVDWCDSNLGMHENSYKWARNLPNNILYASNIYSCHWCSNPHRWLLRLLLSSLIHIPNKHIYLNIFILVDVKSLTNRILNEKQQILIKFTTRNMFLSKG